MGILTTPSDLAVVSYLDRQYMDRIEIHQLPQPLFAGYEYRWVYKDGESTEPKWTEWQRVPCSEQDPNGRLAVEQIRAQILEGFQAQIRYLSATAIEGYDVVPGD